MLSLTFQRDLDMTPVWLIRAVPVVEAMEALVLADYLLMNRSVMMIQDRPFVH